MTLTNGVIFENYQQFINDHQDDFSCSDDILRFQSDKSNRDALCESLLSSITDDGIRKNLSTLFEAQTSLLTESALGGAIATPWAVSMYPILFDVYHDSTIIQVANVHKAAAPALSVPRIRIKAQATDMNGKVIQEQFIPYPGKAARLNSVDVNILPTTDLNATQVNVFNIAGVNDALFGVNRTFTYLSQVTITENVPASTDPVTGDPIAASTVTRVIDVNATFDVRRQISEVVHIRDAAGKLVDLKLTMTADWDTGEFSPIMYSFVMGESTSTFTLDSGKLSVRFTPKNTLNGRVRVNIFTENIDVILDQNEDFLINLTEEQIQDYTSIFKVDLLRLLSEAIKKQVLLQKDHDLAFALRTSELAIADHGAKFVWPPRPIF